MTDDEYLERSASAQRRLEQVREQVHGHVGRTNDKKAESPLVRPLLDRQQEIIDELTMLDEQYWNS